MLMMVFSCTVALKDNINVTVILQKLTIVKRAYSEYNLSSLQLPNWLFTLCVIAQRVAGSHLLLRL